MGAIYSMIAGQYVPEDVPLPSDFKIDQYLGNWYEIARFDHSFERDLENVTTCYTSREDGGVDVMNKGYNPKTDSWSEKQGYAYFINGREVPSMKVTFFWPFTGGYNVIDTDYDTYSLVCGTDRNYLWILSRSPTLSEDTVQSLKSKAASLGFLVENFLFINQTPISGKSNN